MDSTIKEPHTISLKVLRLSRPQLATQDPLPADPTIPLSHQASLALPSASIDDIFTLTPLLTFPTTFGTAYVGESFSCILSLNNELPQSTEKRILSVKVSAEMQTPSQTRPLDFNPSLDSLAESGLAHPGEKGANVQSILGFDLREEGNHVLCVNISYTESVVGKKTAAGPGTADLAQTQKSDGDGAASTTAVAAAPDVSSAAAATSATITTGGRVRLLRKLYNFNVGPCLSVRTKATAVNPIEDATNSSVKERYLLECQLENLADDTITMERLVFEARAPFGSKSLNWDAEHVEVPVLAPREVTQVAFLVAEEEFIEGGAGAGAGAGEGGGKKEITKDGRAVLGVLTIHWRSAMGCLGVLSTGWLASRPRKT